MSQLSPGLATALGARLAKVWRDLSVAVAVLIELRIALAALGANPGSPIVRLLEPLADHLAAPFQRVFIPPDPTLGLALDDGLATVAYLAAGLVAARLTVRSGEVADGVACLARDALRRRPALAAGWAARLSSPTSRARALVAVVLLALLWQAPPQAPARRVREPLVSHRLPARWHRPWTSTAPPRTDAWVAGNPLSPCHPQVTQGYGPTSMWGEPVIDGVRFHTGIDLACPAGTPVSSLTGGVAHVATGWDEGFGTSVVVEVRAVLPDAPRPETYFVRYAHLADVRVRDGEAVRVGQVLGHEGMSGFTTGPHLHFEVDEGKPEMTSSANPTCLLRL